MAEQFILPNAKSKVVRSFLAEVKCTITDLMHEDIGWNPTSRAQYDGMMGLNGAAPIVNRNGLPPHFYIEIPVNTYVPSSDLVRGLSRGVLPLVTLKALTKEGQVEWNQGRYAEAVNTETKKGNVSVCIYHLDGVEVTDTERDKVNGFPKKS